MKNLLIFSHIFFSFHMNEKCIFSLIFPKLNVFNAFSMWFSSAKNSLKWKNNTRNIFSLFFMKIIMNFFLWKKKFSFPELFFTLIFFNFLQNIKQLAIVTQLWVSIVFGVKPRWLKKWVNKRKFNKLSRNYREINEFLIEFHD